jgi:hypothetical protein
VPVAEKEAYCGPEQTVSEEVAEVAVEQPNTSMIPISGSQVPLVEVALAVAVKPPETRKRVQVELDCE